MRTTKIKVMTMLLAAFGIMVLTVAPVAADTSSGSSGSGDSSTTTSGDSSETENPQPDQTEVENDVRDFRNQGIKDLSTLRQNAKSSEHSAADHQQACKAHQTEINTKISNFSRTAQNRLDVFNKIFARVQAFQTSKAVTVPNWDTLIATATTDQTAAANAVAALKTLSVNVDCTSADPAASLTVVKDAANAAKTALQTYRTDIKNVIVALGKALDQSSSSTSDSSSSTTGGTQ